MQVAKIAVKVFTEIFLLQVVARLLEREEAMRWMPTDSMATLSLGEQHGPWDKETLFIILSVMSNIRDSFRYGNN